jgi:hypothetical protein
MLSWRTRRYDVQVNRDLTSETAADYCPAGAFDRAVCRVVAVERGWGSGGGAADIHQEAGAPQETSEGEGAHSEADENAEAGENAEANEAQAHSEVGELAIAGVDLESPWTVAAVVFATLLLIAALWRFGYPVLFVVLVVAALATVADIREIIVQAGQGRYGVAALATGVAVARLATVVVTLLALREGRIAARTPALKV